MGSARAQENTPPYFGSPTPECGGVVDVVAGEQVTFTIAVFDSTEGDTIIVSGMGIPSAATLTPALPDTGNPVMTDFVWTPIEEDVGDHVVEFTAVDTGGATASCSITIRVASPNEPPNCDEVEASITEIWPPNHKFVTVHIDGFTDPDGDAVSYEIVSVTQDEPVDGSGDGSTACDARIENGKLQVRAERSGSGNGRVYEIAFSASDSSGATCEGTVRVCVPHDRGKHTSCVDDGQLYDSMGPCADDGEEEPPPDESERLQVSIGRTTQAEVEVHYTLPEAGSYAIDLYNVAGRRVASVGRGRQTAGSHSVMWSTTGLTRGIYFIRLRTDGGAASKHVYLGR